MISAFGVDHGGLVSKGILAPLKPMVPKTTAMQTGKAPNLLPKKPKQMSAAFAPAPATPTAMRSGRRREALGSHNPNIVRTGRQR